MWDNQISYRFEKKEHRFDVMEFFNGANQDELLKALAMNFHTIHYGIIYREVLLIIRLPDIQKPV